MHFFQASVLAAVALASNAFSLPPITSGVTERQKCARPDSCFQAMMLEEHNKREIRQKLCASEIIVKARYTDEGCGWIRISEVIKGKEHIKPGAYSLIHERIGGCQRALKELTDYYLLTPADNNLSNGKFVLDNKAMVVAGNITETDLKCSKQNQSKIE